VPNIELSKAARADPGLLAGLRPLIDQVATDHADRPDLVQVFSDALTITLATTVRPFPASSSTSGDGTTFVATGDIAAMWLRDSSAQVETYLRVAEHNPDLRRVLEGVTRRQAAYVAVDPYANAFNEQPADGHHGTDTPQPGPWVWERKYELDSLCYPIRFAYGLWTKGRTTDHLTADVRTMFATIVRVMRTEQDHEASSPYRFQRETTLRTETLLRAGKGARTAPIGMVWSGFRPSDDACTYGFLVPANMFAVVSLGQLAEMLREVYRDHEAADEADRLGAEIREAIESHGVADHPDFGRIYAYEVDGLGNQLLCDDANIPSLLSAPYLGYCAADDPTYVATRNFVLSKGNPYYYVGTHARGIGSPHTYPGWIWPMALTMQAITATTDDEVRACVDTLLATTGGTGLMHESFDANDPNRYSRDWFGWANSLFTELILRRGSALS
jgi:meiotically up-regulated gene 157 (Mug157) protein